MADQPNTLWRVSGGRRPEGYGYAGDILWWTPIIGLDVADRADAEAIAALVLKLPGVLAVRIDAMPNEVKQDG